MMPTDLEDNPMCINKKQHIGNDFVSIVWNDSGHEFNFNTFPSAFNYVYIVITPESDADFVALRKGKANMPTLTNSSSPDGSLPSSIRNLFYRVQVLSAPGFPSISPAAEAKVISSKSLAPYVRLLALNASFFSLVWAEREGGEHVSPWRNRLRVIKSLREKFGGQQLTSSLQVPGTQPEKISHRVSRAFGGGDGNED
jgi:hypothetical protein